MHKNDNPKARYSLEVEYDPIDRAIAERQAAAIEKAACALDRVNDNAEVLTLLRGLNRKVEALMKTVAQFAQEMDNATNLIAERIQKLIDAGALSAADEAALEAIVVKLTALGKNPEVPPDVTPIP